MPDLRSAGISLALACVVALLMTPACRAVGRRLRLLDIPNERSSHAVPTPRTGGYAIAAGLAFAWIAGGAWHDANLRALFIGAVMVAALAAVDERRPLPRPLRFAIQLAVASGVLVVAQLSLGTVETPFGVVRVGLIAGVVLGVAWVTWITNAYNFMDGINGLASFEAVIAGSTLAVLAADAGDLPAAVVAGALAGAALGFLPWNLTGSIFMGDVGSTTFGFAFGVIALRVGSTVGFVAAVLPLLPFLLDATSTLLMRMVKGERFFSTPHRSHFYQRLVRQGFSHATVSALWGGLAIVCACVALGYAAWSPPVQAGTLAALLALHVAVGLLVLRGDDRAQPRERGSAA